MDIFQDTLFRDLEKLNFTVNESKVYLTLVRIGSSLAGNIASHAKLDRSSTYNALKSLQDRGIISTIFENDRTIYLPEPPKKILDYYKEKEAIAQNIIPKLQEQFKFHSQNSTVKLYQGYKGIKTIFQNIIDSCDEKHPYLVLSSEGHFSQKMPYYAPHFRKQKEQKKIKTKMIIRESREKKSIGKYSEYKSIPFNTISPVTINIYKDKVAIVLWEDNPQAILIEHANISKTFAEYFQFIWKHAK
ncbi:hypothetical protein A2642_01785 [Candidatus Nomurabacteria bacterium RIFCSPHIGHO2_01_FULL_39_10]|uniref:Transcription regulator TrmB N-terminal domain-containing protein n=1 Tax=Candidatus Nomurabacteria bacterium RIFCSPHIGHO2_01_FULL_39_10 TaxID=1801733 RepID=A0A1F6V4E5_9BACT|nr:MAG: hypothetical protein A2642_01785 [Candidatus Nomurabacteria bacterium RIFCSPHIGHO2_01_FULL_39_10]